MDALRLLEANSARVIKSRENYNQLFDDDDCSDDLESSGGPIAAEGNAN
jgi:hypothetical protein